MRKNASTARGSLSISTSNVPSGKVGNFVSPTCCPPPQCQWTCQCDNPAFNEIRTVDTPSSSVLEIILHSHVMRLTRETLGRNALDSSPIFLPTRNTSLIFSFVLSLVEREASLERNRVYVSRIRRRNKARALGILGTGVGANRPGRNLRANFEGGNSITTLLDLPQAPTLEALPRIAHIALFRSISNPKRAVAKPKLTALPMSCTLNYARVPSRYESEAFLPLLPRQQLCALKF